jgi:hypothetical protein
MLRRWDFATCSCGKRHQDEVITRARIPKTIKCECGLRVGWVLGKTNGIHATTSALYGRWEPGLGEFVESYSHKKQLMKEQGVIEASDPVGGSRCHQPSDTSPRPIDESNNSTWMDDGDLHKAEQEALERASRGDFDLKLGDF